MKIISSRVLPKKSKFVGGKDDIGKEGLLESNDVITHFHGCHALTHGLNDAGTLMAEYDGEGTFRVFARQSVGV